MFLQYLGLTIGLSIAVVPLVIAWRLSRIDRLTGLVTRQRVEARRYASHVWSVRDVIMGKAQCPGDWLPDERFHPGMIYNRREHRIEISRRLSDAAFDRIFRSRLRR